LKKSVWYPDHSDFGSKFKYTVKKSIISCVLFLFWNGAWWGGSEWGSEWF